MAEPTRASNFLTDIIDDDLAAGRNGGRVVTRFPPEPNGFLHIGHAKSILLNFGLARRYSGHANLRFDDTNPTTEDTRYVESIENDVRWLGGDWGKNLFFASDYFEKMYACAERLVKEGKAYVDTQPVEAIREQRGSFEKPGTNSPFRDRPVDENLALLKKMRAGELPDGAAVLRAKIDMSATNVLMRDPLLYRIRHAHHHRTKDAWCIYPMYDFAHPLEDAFEGVTHSICTLEFESNRELYDWVLEHCGPWETRPHQYEFARLALGYTVMSKRKLLQLVNEKRVSGWDDPRMPTLAGMRRRGVTPEALQAFAEMIGVAKNNSLVDIGKLEHAIRTDLEPRAPKGLAVIRPLKVTITNWPEEKIDEVEIPWWPGELARGTRKAPFGRDVVIDEEDFAENPPKDWKRLAPGREVRLVGAYVVKCERVVKDASGKVVALECTHDASSRGGAPADGRKVPGTLHWVHATQSKKVTVRLYNRLFRVEEPDAEANFLDALNPHSLDVASEARVEPALASAKAGERVQFLRTGYFFVDPIDSKDGEPVFNRIITLKDSWTKATLSGEASVAAAPAVTKAASAAAKGTSSVTASATVSKKSRVELRAEARASNPTLVAKFEAYQRDLKLSKDDADVLTGDEALARYFDAASANASPPVVARWLLNELLGLAKEASLDSLAIDGRAFGKFVALVESGRLTQAAGKTLFADLVANGGDPEARMKEKKLEKSGDTAAVATAVARALAKHEAEVARYRAGETKLLGVLLGAAMRETQGVADAGTVKKLVLEKLA